MSDYFRPLEQLWEMCRKNYPGSYSKTFTNACGTTKNLGWVYEFYTEDHEVDTL